MSKNKHAVHVAATLGTLKKIGLEAGEPDESSAGVGREGAEIDRRQGASFGGG